MKQYHRRRQTFTLQLPPGEERDEQMRLFGELQKTCKEDTPVRQKHSNWILEESWQIFAHQAMLRRTGHQCQMGGFCLQRQIGASL
jgi:hypothetical protein